MISRTISALLSLCPTTKRLSRTALVLLPAAWPPTVAKEAAADEDVAETT